MNGKSDDATQKRLIAIFRTEAQERLNVLSSGLVALERAEAPLPRAQLFESLMREAHSLKGAARSVGLLKLEALSRTLEQALASLKAQAVPGSPALFDVLHGAVDAMRPFLATTALDERGAEARAIEEATESVGRLFAFPGEQPAPLSTPPSTARSAGAVAQEAPVLAPAAERPVPMETVRISSERLAKLLLEVEQLLSAKLAEEHYVTRLHAAGRMLAEWKKALRERRGAPAPDFLAQELERISRLMDSVAALERSAAQNYRFVSSAVSNLLSDIKNVLMLPFSTLFGPFPKMVRDLSRSRGKEVDLVIEGGELEVDKRVLDEIKDALIHLVRNGIDHGIESPEERESKGKPRRGRITVSVVQRGADRIEIDIADDGAGMDAGKIRAAAVRHGVVASLQEAARLNERDALSLAFRSGVTTSPIVTDISGRGLGLAIAQEKVANLNGALDFETVPDKGTTIRVVLPLTLATFRGVVVQCEGQTFIVPSANVEQALRTAVDAIRTVENRQILNFSGEVISVVRLADILELTESQTVAGAAGRTLAIVLSAGGRRMAFIVDGVVNEQEVLVKPLGKQLARVRNVGGAAVLGTGEVVPILNVSDLLASAIKREPRSALSPAAPGVGKETRSLLVVEDSITTRTLLRNILEAAGYSVHTAVDGLDAFNQLREKTIDLVVSDVVMPHMDGFELTTRIRADERLARLPVVLVTALESYQERERGVDAGANAYIVKSSFDQSNLLETIERLI